MSLNDHCAEHVSQQMIDSENLPTLKGSNVEFSPENNTTPYKRRRQTNQALEALGRLVKDSSSDDIDEKLNKNDILGLTIARLLRRKYVPFNLVNSNIPLAAELPYSNASDHINGFLIVLNMAGRILFISDTAEYHLRKNVRSLYTQTTTIYQCINQENHESMQKILATKTSEEQNIICTWNLPRGKRPSRAHSESKSMLISGHYFFFDIDKDQYHQEPVFLAKCEQILSSTPNIPSTTTGSTNNNILRFVLDENLDIIDVLPNIKSLLGYQPDDLIDRSIDFLITSEYWADLLQAKENCFQSQHSTTMSVMDIYSSSGERLTFLCNTYAILENKRKPLKFGFLAQLINPYIRDQCLIYVKKQNDERWKSVSQTDLQILSQSSFDGNPMSTSSSPTVLGDQYLNLTSLTSVCPATVIPQRRKRRRSGNHQIKQDISSIGSKIQKISSTHQDIHNSILNLNTNSHSPLSSSPENSTGTFSPVQEINALDDFLFDVEQYRIDEKLDSDAFCPSYEDFSDIFGINTNYHQSLFLATPTLTTCAFFA